MTPQVVVAAAAETVGLRQRVLRPHETIEAMAERDRTVDADAVHLGVRAPDGTVVATGNVRRARPPWDLPVEAHAAEGAAGAAVAGDPAGAAVAGDTGRGAAEPGVWRIRGMATDAAWRGQGLGGAVLAGLVDHVAASGGGFVWCNARVGALSLYERAGFTPIGGRFEEPHIGEHQAMWLVVGSSQ